MTATTDPRAKMIALTKAQRTEILCEALRDLAARPKRDTAESLAHATIIDVLCERHPEVEAAFQAWAEEEENTETAVQAITRAALDAAKR